jgi:hypothetical protein
MSTFDADTFLHTTVEEANETSFLPVPEDEYEALVDNIKPVQRKDSTILEVTWDILSEELRAAFNRSKVTCRQSVFLDVSESGALLFGPNNNVQLGRLRDALGQNTAGPWSPNDLKGAGPAYIRVRHSDNPSDPDNPYANVTGVAARPGETGS